jgi:hypothetical protein
MRNHDAIVDAKHLIRAMYSATSIFCHLAHHLLESQIAPYPSDHEDLCGTDMCHGPLCNLDKHGICRLLQGKAQVFIRNQFSIFTSQPLRLGHVLPHLLNKHLHTRQDAGKAAIHPLDGIRQIQQPLPLPRHDLDIVPGRRIVRNPEHPRKPIQAVPDRYIQRLPEDPVAVRGVGNHLRVATAHVQHHRIPRPRDGSSHFNVSDAVIDADEFLAPHQRQRARDNGDGLQWCAHAWSLGVAYAVNVCYADAGALHRGLDKPHYPGPVVLCRVLGQEAAACWWMVGVAKVGEDNGRFVGFGCMVLDDADAEFVCGAFESQGDHFHPFCVRVVFGFGMWCVLYVCGGSNMNVSGERYALLLATSYLLFVTSFDLYGKAR